MKPESLRALIIDHHLGELPPETAELLEHHLAAHPPAREEASRVLAALDSARSAVNRHPELARVPPPAPAPRPAPQSASFHPWFARAASIALLAAVVGFITGRSLPLPHSPPLADSGSPAPGQVSPWARYRMAFDPSGAGMRVVRLDPESLSPRSSRP